jgi:hypothetical protein
MQPCLPQHFCLHALSIGMCCTGHEPHHIHTCVGQKGGAGRDPLSQQRRIVTVVTSPSAVYMLHVACTKYYLKSSP